MKDISIFIAGATKETKEERECLKVLANDLSYEKRGLEVGINAMSYKNFDDNQVRYNEFIEHDADLVFVILKGKLGEKTKEELIKAAEARRENNRPDIVVFLDENSMNEDSSDAGEIRGLMEALLKQQYPVRYKTLEELKSAAKTRIERYLEKISEQKEHVTRSSKKETFPTNAPCETKRTSRLSGFFRYWQAWLLLALTLIAGGLLLYVGLSRNDKIVSIFNPPPTSNPILVFAGGGSVYQYLKSIRGIDVGTPDNSIYIRMPSSQSWMLLAEEVNRKNNSANKFFPISLSACEAQDSAFVKACTDQEFKKRAAIISYYLGEDTLVLYMTDTIYRNYKKKYGLDKPILSKNDFGKLIKELRNDSVQILHTTPTSGTLKCWQTCMDPTDATIIENNDFIFNEISSIDILNPDDRYVILGSKNYFMQNLKGKSGYENFIIERTIFDEKDGLILSKPIYLYFVAYKDKNGISTSNSDDSREKVWLPDEVMRFLKQLKIEDEVKKDTLKWNFEKGFIYNDNPRVILHLNERPKKLK